MSQSQSKFDSRAEVRLGIDFWISALSVYGLLIAFSLLRVPIPGVNEPHYLCKAKHFWNPEWCREDFFLTSSNPHLVFYVTFGWLTQFLSLHSTAVIGRIAGLLPLAIGWQCLNDQLTRRRGTSVLALATFLFIQSTGNWSGEWLAGGIESKVISYGFLFWALAQALKLKLPSSAFLAGLAISFHPVVGVWGTLATSMATVFFVLLNDKEHLRANSPSGKAWGLAVILFLLAASPGLVSAAQAVLGSDPEQSRIANLLQVGHRLAHHLDPMKFPKSSYRFFGCLIIFWVLLIPSCWKLPKHRWWTLFVSASLLFAAIGIAIGFGPRPLKEMAGYEWRMTALKFYPFRLADLMVPVAISFAFADQLRTSFESRFAKQSVRYGFAIVSILLFAAGSLMIPGSDKTPSKMSPVKRANWIAACNWIQENTKESDLIHSFGNDWAVKWFCDRPEYVNYKDCPQDSASIIEWNRRRWVISRWKQKTFLDRSVSLEELQNFSEATNVKAIICDRLGPIEMEPSYRNSDFRVYLISPPSSSIE